MSTRLVELDRPAELVVGGHRRQSVLWRRKGVFELECPPHLGLRDAVPCVEPQETEGGQGSALESRVGRERSRANGGFGVWGATVDAFDDSSDHRDAEQALRFERRVPPRFVERLGEGGNALARPTDVAANLGEMQENRLAVDSRLTLCACLLQERDRPLAVARLMVPVGCFQDASKRVSGVGGRGEPVACSARSAAAAEAPRACSFRAASSRTAATSPSGSTVATARCNARSSIVGAIVARRA